MRSIIRLNERSWAIDLITKINLYLSSIDLLIKKAGGEITISSQRTSMFPDLILYADNTQNEILQGWELKLPDTLITDDIFINDGKRKAIALGTNSYFLWNFSYGALYIRDHNNNFNLEKLWTVSSHLQTRDDVSTYENEWLPVIHEILHELNDYFSRGIIRQIALADVITENLVLTIIERNNGRLATRIYSESIRNATIKSELNVWWNQVAYEYLSDSQNMYHAYSKVIILHWINRIIFANLIKRYYEICRRIEDIDYSYTPQMGNHLFQEFTNKCDFFNVFSPIDFDELIDTNSWHDIIDFNSFLKERFIYDIDQFSFQEIFEKTVNVSKRALSGQYCTPRVLASLLVRATVVDWTGDVIDPCCGTGSLVKSVLEEKINRIGVEEAYKTGWGSDKFSFPLQIASINVIKPESISLPCKLFQQNLFDLENGLQVEIKDPKDGSLLTMELPLFDTIVSNLPFIPFENIDADEENRIGNLVSAISNETGIIHDGRGDIYSYMIFKLWDILNINGRLGVIVSNSWLGTNWGRKFFALLKLYFNIKGLLISGVGKWFNNADIITTILILEKKQITEQTNGPVGFFLLNKTLHELSQSERDFETVVDSILLSRVIDQNIVNVRHYDLDRIDNLLNLGIGFNAFFYNIDWLAEIEHTLIPITNLFSISRGERRGWNDLYYPRPGHSIEPQFIKPVLRKPKNLHGLKAITDAEAFCCNKSIDQLTKDNDIGALRWIRKFEQVTNERGKPLPQVLARNNSFWYEMSDSASADMVTSINPNKRLFVSLFDEPTFVDQRFTKLNRIDQNIDLELCHALLNTVLGMFYIEAIGFGRGLGVLDTNSTNFSKVYMLNPDFINPEQRIIILELFNKLMNRDIEDTEIEVELADRIDFDKYVLNVFGIEEKYNLIKNSLIAMQKARLSVHSAYSEDSNS